MKYADIKLAVPKGRHSADKLKAYKAHWRGIAEVRDELSRAYIHDGTKLSKVCEEAQIGHATGKRFFEFGKGNGRLTYSYFHGPAATTVFGIANALGMRIKLEKVKR